MPQGTDTPTADRAESTPRCVAVGSSLIVTPVSKVRSMPIRTIDSYLRSPRDFLRKIGRRLARTERTPPRTELGRLIDEGIVCYGAHSYGEPTVLVWRDEHGMSLGGRVTIGRYCSIADGVTIFTGGNHRPEWVTTYPMRVMFELHGRNADGHPASKGDVIIGHDVWLSHGATILSGVTIGIGAVVGANAVVARDVRPYSIVVGNPAVEIRRRFDDDCVDRLLESRWWELSDSQVVSLVPVLCSPDVDRALSAIARVRV